MTMQTDDRIQEILAQASQATAGGNGEGGGEGDDSFDANEYVKDLIARMSNEDGTPIATPNAPSETPAEPVEEPVEERMERSLEQMTVAIPNASSDAPAEREPVLTSLEACSKAALPVDMEQLREAANLTSSSALRRSGREDLGRRCSLSFILAASCIAMSLVLLSLSSGRYSTAYFASVGMALIAAYSTIRYSNACRVLAKMARFDEQNRAIDSPAPELPAAVPLAADAAAAIVAEQLTPPAEQLS